MTIQEKCAKLIEFSLVIQPQDKKNWQKWLPTMTDDQVQALYGVLVSEVKAWKKEGITLVPDSSVELGLLPAEPKGASVSSLISRLEGKTPPAQLPKDKPAPKATTPFGKELERELNTPELKAPAGVDNQPANPVQAEEKPEPDLMMGEFKPEIPDPSKSAWMLSNKVTVPKSGLGVIKPQPKAIPKIRNRVAKHGLTDLKSIRTVDDLSKIEGAHLRQGPLADQVAFIKQRIAQLARENDMLPINILPVFEQSPLFQSYLKAGAMLIERNDGEDNKMVLEQIMGDLESMGQDPLTQEEFETVADLKKDLETMAGL